MASVTRSSRRAEGPTPHFTNPTMRSRPASLDQVAMAGGGGGGGGGGTGGGRTKRALEPDTERNHETVASKKARVSVGVLGDHPHARSNRIASAGGGPKPGGGGAAPPQPPQKQAPARWANESWPPREGAGNRLPPPPQAPDQGKNLTKHQSKVINGIKHELDRLQPQLPAKKEEPGGRKLRSQEASRFKSELSAYFPDYDEVIGNEPKEEHLLNVETPILVYDSSKLRGEAATEAQSPTHQPHKRNNSNATTRLFPVRGYGDALYTDIVDAQRIDFSFLEAQHKNKALQDPLSDTLFQHVHKRAERLERSIRNTEKGRAQHEKDQIIRLLEGLQGPDWLRVMGVSGVTETKKKTFEPARRHFIHGCEAILAKFRNWNLEEKRRKLKKERALAEKAEEEEEEGDQEEEEVEEDEEVEEQGADESQEAAEESVVSDERSTTDHSESSSVSPAKQLREEALARSRLAAKAAKAPPRPRPRPAQKPLAPPAPPGPPPPPAPPREFTSFFSKKGERDAALNRTRRSGRKVLAWGHPVPEFPEADFDLPEEYRDEETLRARARKKRRDKRGSKV